MKRKSSRRGSISTNGRKIRNEGGREEESYTERQGEDKEKRE